MNKKKLSKKFFLALVPDENYWDKNSEIFFLSEESCHFTSKHRKAERFLLNNFWEKQGVLQFSINRTQNVYDEVLDIVSKEFNRIHNLEHSSDYWSKILGFFLSSYIDTLYDKYIKLKSLQGNIHDYSFLTIESSNYITLASPNQFVQGIRASNFLNLQIFSQILTSLNVDSNYVSQNNLDLLDEIESIKRKELPSIKSFLISIFRKVLGKGYNSDIVLFASLFSNKSLLKLFFKTKFKCRPVFTMRNLVKTKDDFCNDKRIFFRDFYSDDEFTNLVVNSLYINMPHDFIENFSVLNNKAKLICNNGVPKAIFTGVGFLIDSLFSIWAAECSLYGAKIYGVQHGGTYGEVEYINGGEILERSLTDFYVTWGWSKDSTTIPMPAQKFIGFRPLKKHIKNSGFGILWITSADSPSTTFIGKIVFGSRYLQYFEHQKRIFSNLSEGIIKNIDIRLYPKDFGWKLKQRWLSISKSLRFADSKIPLLKQATKYQLLIVDHFGGTSTLECLALNKPIIIIGNEKLFAIDTTAKVYYEKLCAVNILFFDSREAASFLNHFEKLDSVDDWWFEPKRQKAINDFLKNYARLNVESINEWSYFFKRIIKE